MAIINTGFTSGSTSSDDDNDSGTLDQAGSFFSRTYDRVAGAADHAAGSTDEAVARSTDDQEGGGFLDGLRSFTGVTSYQQTEDFRDLNEQYRETQGDTSLRGHAERLDIGTRAAGELLLDNPNASAQEAVQTGMVEAYRMGSGRDDATSKDVAESFQRAATNYSETTSEALEGTALDNKATDYAVAGFDMFLADPAKATFKGTTGVNLEGSDEATVGAVDAADVLLTVGTAGVGKTGLAAAKGGAKSGGFFAKVLGRGADDAARATDDATPALTSGADESTRAVKETSTVVDDAGQAGDDVIDLTRAGDETAGGFRRFVADTLDNPSGAVDDALATVDDATPALSSGADDAARVVDDAGSAADDAASGFRSRVLGASDEAARGADEAATATDDAAQAADESGGLLDDLLGRSDEAAQAGDEGASLFSRVTSRLSRSGDEAAQASDEAGGRLRGFLGTRTGKVTLGGGAFLAGGAVGGDLIGSPQDAPDEIETASGHRMVFAKDYEPVEKYPNGGRLYAVTKDYENIGYWLLLGSQGRNLVVLDGNGDTRRAKIDVEQFQSMMQNQGGSQ